MTIDDRLRESGAELRAVAQTIERRAIGSVGRRRRGWVYGLATAVVMLGLVGGGFWFAGSPGGQGSPVATQPVPTTIPVTTLPGTVVPEPESNPVSQPEPETEVTPRTPPTTTVPAVVEPEPSEPLMTYEEMYRRFEERNARAAAEDGFPVSEMREGYDQYQTDVFRVVTSLAAGKRAPDLVGRYLEPSVHYPGTAGTFAMDDFIGSPTIVMLWQGLWVDEHNYTGSRGLGAFQELMDSDLGGVRLLSVLLQPSGTGYAQEILSEAGYDFPVLVGPEPDTWGLAPLPGEVFFEPLPLWVALDEDWRVLGVSNVGSWHGHFLVAEILGVPDIGPIEVSSGPSDVTPFTKEDGLPSDCVSSIEIAGDGDVWVGSGCGVARYDGQEWSPYLGKAESIVYAAPDGSLWVATPGTIYRVDGTELVPVLTERPWEGGFGSLAVTTDGTIWSSDGDQMNWSYDGAGWRSHSESAPVGMAGNFTAAPDGSLWAGNETDLRRFDGTDWEITTHPARWPISPTFAPDGTAWLEGGQGGIFEYREGAWIHHDQGGTYLEDIAFGPEGDLWAISPDDGAYRYDGQEWSRYTTADGLPTNHLTTVVVAPDGTVWLSTLESGVVKFTP